MTAGKRLALIKSGEVNMSYKKIYDFLSSFRWQLKELGKTIDIPDDVISRLESDIFIVILAIDTYMLNLGKRYDNAN